LLNCKTQKKKKKEKKGKKKKKKKRKKREKKIVHDLGGEAPKMEKRPNSQRHDVGSNMTSASMS